MTTSFIHTIRIRDRPPVPGQFSRAKEFNSHDPFRGNRYVFLSEWPGFWASAPRGSRDRCGDSEHDEQEPGSRIIRIGGPVLKDVSHCSSDQESRHSRASSFYIGSYRRPVSEMRRLEVERWPSWEPFRRLTKGNQIPFVHQTSQSLAWRMFQDQHTLLIEKCMKSYPAHAVSDGTVSQSMTVLCSPSSRFSMGRGPLTLEARRSLQIRNASSKDPRGTPVTTEDENRWLSLWSSQRQPRGTPVWSASSA